MIKDTKDRSRIVRLSLSFGISYPRQKSLEELTDHEIRWYVNEAIGAAIRP